MECTNLSGQKATWTRKDSSIQEMGCSQGPLPTQRHHRSGGFVSLAYKICKPSYKQQKIELFDLPKDKDTIIYLSKSVIVRKLH
jgi:hypothetical protein